MWLELMPFVLMLLYQYEVCVELLQNSGYFNLMKHADDTSIAINNGAEMLDREENVCRLQGSLALALSHTWCKNAHALAWEKNAK